MKYRWIITILIWIPLASSAAGAAVRFPTSLTFKSLDQFWQNSLNKGDFDSDQFYGNLFTEPVATEEQAVSALVSYYNEVNGVQKAVRFSIQPIPAQLEARMSRREMGLGLYQSQEGRFTEETFEERILAIKNRARLDKESQILLNRRASAKAEIILINLRRYLAASTLGNKCQYLKKAAAQLEGLRSIETTGLTDITAKTNGLMRLARKYADLYEGDLKKQIACTAALAHSAPSARIKIETQVNDLLAADLEQERTNTLDGITKASGDFRSRLDDIVKIDPMTTELLEAERDLTDAASNVEFMARDMLGLEQYTEDFNAINLKAVEKVSDDPSFRPDAIIFLKQAEADLITATREWLKEFQTVAQRPEFETDPEWKPCLGLEDNLNTAFPAFDEDKKVTMQAEIFFKPYRKCFAKATATLKRLQEENDDRLLVKNFAKYVESLSKQILEQRQR